MSTLSIRQTVFLVVLFVVTATTFIALDNRRALDPLKTALHDLITPITELVSGIGDDTNDGALAQQLERVKAERDALAAENARLKLQVNDIDKLRELLNFQEAHAEWRVVHARVLGPDPSGLQKLIVIDKGSADGIRKGMAVVDPNYFVGLVTEVEEHAARVTLAIDGSAVIGARLLDSGAGGIVRGLWQRGGRMELAYVDLGVALKAGEVVVTSDDPETRTAGVPGGLIIGRLEGEPNKNTQGDSQTIQILPATDFDNLTMVAVVVDDAADGA